MIMIMRGIPGSGKSTHIKQFNERMSSTVLEIRVCSADLYHTTPDGRYEYKKEEVTNAHRQCFRAYITLVENSKTDNSVYIFVDNTNITALDFAPYARVAEAFEHPYMIVTCKCDAYVACSRCIHGLSQAYISQKHAELELADANFPPWFAKHHDVIFTGKY